MLLLHEVHRVRGDREGEFEKSYRDAWLPELAKGDDARLLYFMHLAHGSGRAYTVVTITGVRDGAAYERLARRIQDGDLRAWTRDVDQHRHVVTGKALLTVPWAPQLVELDAVPTEPQDHELTLFMEDTAWPHEGRLEEYLEAARDALRAEPRRGPPRRPVAARARRRCSSPHGAPRPPREVVLWQRVTDYARRGSSAAHQRDPGRAPRAGHVDARRARACATTGRAGCCARRRGRRSRSEAGQRYRAAQNRAANSSTRARPWLGHPHTRYSNPASRHVSTSWATSSRSSSSESDPARMISPDHVRLRPRAPQMRPDLSRSTSGGPKQCQTSAYRAAMRHHALLARCADPDRRVRLLHRSRAQRGVVHLEWRPSNVKPSVVSNPRTICTASSKRVDTLTRRREGDAEPVVLVAVPGRAVGKLEPPARRVIDGDGLCRIDRRMAVGHAGDEQSEPDAVACAAQGRERRHTLEALARAFAVHRLEVVEPPDPVEAGVVGEARTRHQLAPRHALLRDIQAESHGHRRGVYGCLRGDQTASCRRSQPGGGGASRQNCSGAGAASFAADLPVGLERAQLRRIARDGPPLARGDPGRRAAPPASARSRPRTGAPPATPAGPGCACSPCPRSRTTPRLGRAARARASPRRGSRRGRGCRGRTARTPRSARRHAPRPRACRRSLARPTQSARARYECSTKSSHTGVASSVASAAASSARRADVDLVARRRSRTARPTAPSGSGYSVRAPGEHRDHRDARVGGHERTSTRGPRRRGAAR